MGLLDRVTDRLRRGSSSQPGPSSARQEDEPGEAPPAWHWEVRGGGGGDERASVIDEELPRYEEIFDTGPLDDDDESAYPSGKEQRRKGRGRGMADPRRRHVRPSAGRLPSAVVDILCSRGYISPSTMFRVSLVSHRLYDVVMTHLYRCVPIERGSIHQLLYGIPLPVQGFVYDPSSDGKGKGKEREVEEEEEQKRHYGYTFNRSIHDREAQRYKTESAAITAASEERKHLCLSYVREVWLEGVIPDWTTCRSLAILGDPGRRFKDTSDNGPSELQYHPMRQSAPKGQMEVNKDKEKKGSSTETSTSSQVSAYGATPLMPNVETLHVQPEAIQAMIHWERVDRTPHLLPDALASLCEPTTVHVHGSVMAITIARWQPDKIERAKLEVSMERTIARLCTAGKRTTPVQAFVWHGVEADSLPYIPHCRMNIHFAPPSTPARQSKMDRIIQIRQALKGLNTSVPLDWRFHSPSLVDQDTEDEHDSVVSAILTGGLEGLDPLPADVTSRAEFIRASSTPDPTFLGPNTKVTGYRYSQQGGESVARARLRDVTDVDLAEVEPSLQNLYLQRTSTGRMK